MTTIVTKNGSGAPLASDLVQGELAVDLTNKRLYTEDSGGTVIEVGTNPSTLTVTGDLAVDTNTLFVDASANAVGIGTSSPNQTGFDANATVASIQGTYRGVLELSSSSTVTNDLIGGVEFLNNGTNESYIRSYTDGSDNGDLRFATNNTEAMRIDSSGNVGIGETSPNSKLRVKDSDATVATLESTSDNSFISFIDSGTGSRTHVQVGSEDNGMVFHTNDSERMRIDASGNVGIGTTSPSGALEVSTSNYGLVFSPSFTSTVGTITFTNGGTRTSTIKSTDFGASLVLSADTQQGNSSTNIIFETDATERMRIDSSGNLLVGMTSYASSSVGTTMQSGLLTSARDGNIAGYFNRLSSDGNIVAFAKDGSTVGSIGTSSGNIIIGTDDTGVMYWGGNAILPWNISTNVERDGAISMGRSGGRFKDLHLSGQWVSNGSNNTVRASFQVSGTQYGYINVATTGTLYSTSSDYRLKENVATLTNATERLKQLNPLRFSFIPDQANTIVDGFLAHEVQDIVPEAILGEKDAIDDDGNPVYQGIDQSKLVPLLTAALQEAVAKIEDLEIRLSAVEAT